jgi:endonuclease G
MNRKIGLPVVLLVGVVLGIICGVFVTMHFFPDETQGTSQEEAWVLRSEHLLYGVPVPLSQRYGDLSVVVRESFVSCVWEEGKAPLWIAKHWTRDDLKNIQGAEAPSRVFREDPELPEHARASPDFRGKTTGIYRGHGSAHEDNLADGEDACRTGCYMSNVIGQPPHLNSGVIRVIEDWHRHLVGKDDLKIDEIWILCGGVYSDASSVRRIANNVAVPEASYKVIAWRDSKGEFNAVAFLIPHDAPTDKPEKFFVSIDDIEKLIGFDLFPQLDDAIERRKEALTATKLL